MFVLVYFKGPSQPEGMTAGSEPVCDGGGRPGSRERDAGSQLAFLFLFLLSLEL